jgi:hypothetical protein
MTKAILHSFKNGFQFNLLGPSVFSIKPTILKHLFKPKFTFFMSKQVFYIIPILILLTGAPMYSQIVDLEQNPPHLKWLQINSEHFKLIFPKDYEKQAQNVVQYLEAVYLPNAKNLGCLPRKIPVIIQSQTAVSNGFVDPIFRRSEFFLTPPQGGFNGSTEWMQALAVHEDRHIVQLSKYRQGRANIFHTLLGDLGGSISFLLVPLWFDEGDAVGTETALTQSGRGRLPDFDLVLRNDLLNNKVYKYPVAINGSYKNPVPNRYVMGYFMTSYMKNHFGANVYDTILSRVYDFKSTYWGANRNGSLVAQSLSGNDGRGNRKVDGPSQKHRRDPSRHAAASEKQVLDQLRLSADAPRWTDFGCPQWYWRCVAIGGI